VTALMTAPLLLVAVPVLSAALGLALWGKPEALRIWLLLATMVSLGTIGWTSGGLPAQAAALPLLSLLPLAAFVSLLGQPLHRANYWTWVITLPLLGLGLGVLASEALLSAVFFLLLLALIGLMLLRCRHQTGFQSWWGIATLAFGVLAGAAVFITEPPLSFVAFALTCAVALPLMPFHQGYVAALTGLPGNLPAFLAFLLPVVGFHEFLTVLPVLPHAVSEAMGLAALAGSLYGSLKALTQSRAASVVAYGGLAFLSILWWYLVWTRTAPPQSLVYLSAVGLVTSGLLLAWYQLRARYGEIGFRALSGLAQPMPRFAIVLSLLALAALGLPPFGVFSGFFGMLLAPSFTWSAGVIVILIAWLTASWYVFGFVQGLLFGRRQAERRYEDLRDPELAALAIVLVLLVVLGVLPSRLFDPGPGHNDRTVVMESPAWNE
jgi:NADH-quinone oxidoreductase subunit M